MIRRKGTLRLVITSATLRTNQLSDYYFNCPIMSVSGRMYPVSILHKQSSKENRVENAVSCAIKIHLHEPAGDVLVFLTGFEECEKATKICFEKLQELAEGKVDGEVVKEPVDVPPMMLASLYGAQSPE